MASWTTEKKLEVAPRGLRRWLRDRRHAKAAAARARADQSDRRSSEAPQSPSTYDAA
jgi:hypothetical protein